MVLIGVSHISLRHKKYNQGSGRKRTKNKRTIRLGSTQVQEGQVCDTLHSWCICRLMLACISYEITTKLPTHPDWPSPHCFWTQSHANWSLLLSGVDCPLPFSVSLRQPLPLGSFIQLFDSRSLAYIRSRPKSRVQTLCLLSRQNRQRDRLLGALLS